MDYSKINNLRSTQLELETIEKIKKLAKTQSELTFDLILQKLNSTTNDDEKFILMLISMLHKKCSNELLLALLYIIS